MNHTNFRILSLPAALLLLAGAVHAAHADEHTETVLTPELAIQLGSGLEPTHAFRANMTATFGATSVSAVRDLSPTDATTTPLTLVAEPGQADRFALRVVDYATGAEVLNYSATLSINTEGTMSLLKDRTWIDPTYWNPKPTTAIAINYGSASAYLVAEALFVDNTTHAATISWGVDENGNGIIDPAERENSTATGASWATQKYYPVLPVTTTLVLNVREGEAQLGSVRGTFYLAGLTTFENQVSEVKAPLKTVRVTLFRIPRDTAIGVNGTEFAAVSTSWQEPGPPGGLPITAGSVAGLTDLVPTCPGGQVFDTSLGCTAPPPTLPPANETALELEANVTVPNEAAATNGTDGIEANPAEIPAAENLTSGPSTAGSAVQGGPANEASKPFPWSGVWYAVLVAGLVALVAVGVRKMRKP